MKIKDHVLVLIIMRFPNYKDYLKELFKKVNQSGYFMSIVLSTKI